MMQSGACIKIGSMCRIGIGIGIGIGIRNGIVIGITRVRIHNGRFQSMCRIKGGYNPWMWE